jgi:hypothetical protein
MPHESDSSTAGDLGAASHPGGGLVGAHAPHDRHEGHSVAMFRDMGDRSADGRWSDRDESLDDHRRHQRAAAARPSSATGVRADRPTHLAACMRRAGMTTVRRPAVSTPVGGTGRGPSTPPRWNDRDAQRAASSPNPEGRGLPWGTAPFHAAPCSSATFDPGAGIGSRAPGDRALRCRPSADRPGSR